MKRRSYCMSGLVDGSSQATSLIGRCCNNGLLVVKSRAHIMVVSLL